LKRCKLQPKRDKKKRCDERGVRELGDNSEVFFMRGPGGFEGERIVSSLQDSQDKSDDFFLRTGGRAPFRRVGNKMNSRYGGQCSSSFFIKVLKLGSGQRLGKKNRKKNQGC
jgi:hypothetical protein